MGHIMRRQDIVKYQILGEVRSVGVQSEGHTELPLHGATKLPLTTMTDKELREFAGMIAPRIGGSIDLIYKGFKRAAQNHKAAMK